MLSSLLSDIDDCASSPCRNNGTCKDDLGDFICSCPPRYKGKTCASSKLLSSSLSFLFCVCVLPQILLYLLDLAILVPLQTTLSLSLLRANRFLVTQL